MMRDNDSVPTMSTSARAPIPPRRTLLRHATRSLACAALLLGACSDSGDGSSTSDAEETSGTTEGPASASEGTTDASTTDATTGETTTTTSDGETTAAEPAFTYHRDIRPVIAASCEQCHTPGNIAPFPLTSYEEVYELRELVALSMLNRQMPPWLAAPDCRAYEHDPSLSQETLDMVETWVAEGAPEGDPDDYVAPPPPPSTELPSVDYALTMPEAYTPVGAPDDYRCFIIDWPAESDTYVTGFRAVPGAVEEVHHAIAFALPPEKLAEYDALDAADPGIGYECFGGPGGEIGSPADIGVWLGAWAPGAAPSIYPEGTGLRIPAGSKIILQVHYNVPADGAVPDQSGVELMVADEVEREAFMMLWADIEWLFGQMPIPAGSPSTVHTWEFDPTAVMSFLTDVIPGGVPIEIHSVTHHMHTVGVRGTHAIRRQGGDECLLQIPRWDFNWQDGFVLSEPATLSPGDRLHLECEYDNSAGDSDLNWGDGTGDEMCLGIYYVTEATP